MENTKTQSCELSFCFPVVFVARQTTTTDIERVRKRDRASERVWKSELAIEWEREKTRARVWVRESAHICIYIHTWRSVCLCVYVCVVCVALTCKAFLLPHTTLLLICQRPRRWQRCLALRQFVVFIITVVVIVIGEAFPAAVAFAIAIAVSVACARLLVCYLFLVVLVFVLFPTCELRFTFT